MEEANTLIGTGKRHLVMADAVSAVKVLEDACSILAKKYGETADECGEAFFLYGEALLELARMENDVLGNALEGVPEEEEEEKKPKDSNIESTENVDEKSRDALRVQVYDAMAEEEEEKNGDSEKSTVKEEGDGDKHIGNSRSNGSDTVEGGEQEEKENGVKSTEVENGEGKESSGKPEEDGDCEEEGNNKEDEVEEDGTEEKDSDDDEEEVGNLQLAWEMLEVAKGIYKRKEGKEAQLLAAQAHLKLGEVASESGNFPQAVEEFQECLALQLKHLSSDSRLLAETHYQLGVIFCFTSQYCEAIEHLNNSISVINRRLDKLREMTDKAEGPDGASKEMEQLKALLPMIQEKVEDAVLGQKMSSVEEATAGGSTSSSAFPANSAIPAPSAQNGGTSTSVITVQSTNGGASSKSAASDISHLVRKKRKPEESPVKESDTKKVKQESHVNGNRDPVRQMNGVKGNEEIQSQ